MVKNNIDRILAGLNDAVEIAEGRASPATYRVHVPEAVDVKSIRRRWGLTQADFAARFGFSVGNVRDWEQGRKQPEPTSRVLLKVIDREPEAVGRALQVGWGGEPCTPRGSQ
jgi:putative transcriptional regulator